MQCNLLRLKSLRVSWCFVQLMNKKGDKHNINVHTYILLNHK